MIENIHYSRQLESIILGSCLMEKTAFSTTYGLIDEESFYDDDNKKIYGVMFQMYKDSIPMDLITVVLKISENGMKLNSGNTAYALSKTMNVVCSTAHLEYHCYLLKNMWRKREIEKLTNSGSDATLDPKDQIKYINEQILNINSNDVKRDWMTMDEVIYELMIHQDAIAKGEKEFITSGFNAIDKENGGFAQGNMVVIGARPSVGKSALMGKMAISMAKKGKKVGIISLEMNNNEIAARLCSLETDIEFYKIYRNLFNDEKQKDRFYSIVSSETVNLPIFISDKTRVDINEIKAKVNKLQRLHGLDCLMVDYLQLVSSESDRNFNREQEVARMSRGLKLMAMEMKIPVVVLCQLNRQSTQRKGTARYPQLSDLRESGAIEQDADVVMMLHRDWLLDGFQADENGNSTEYKADLLVQKWRNGATCHLELYFEPRKMKFSEQNSYTYVPRETNNEENAF